VRTVKNPVLRIRAMQSILKLCLELATLRTVSQQPAQGIHSRFDVVSIRPSKSSSGMRWKVIPDGVEFHNATLEQLIFTAYNVKMLDQISGLPGWAESDRFDINARMDETTTAAYAKLSPIEQGDEQRLMLQSLLMTRFKLEVHREERDRAVYFLTIAKRGIKLQDSQIPETAASMRASRGLIEAKSMTVSVLGSVLSNQVGRMVIDKTGLLGRYDFSLHWSPDLGESSGDSTASEDTAPSIFTALEDDLGLKLQPGKGPVETIVIDHVEKPTVN